MDYIISRLIGASHSHVHTHNTLHVHMCVPYHQDRLTTKIKSAHTTVTNEISTVLLTQQELVTRKWQEFNERYVIVYTTVDGDSLFVTVKGTVIMKWM